MKFAFFGTPAFAAIILQGLIDAKMSPALIICNPDRPVGRKKTITPPLTKIIAEEAGIPVWQPENLEIRNWKLEIDKLGGLDFCIVAAYGKIIPKSVLDTMPAKFVGVHPSLLPKYRGASPIQSAILNNEPQTGVTLYRMDEKVDHGPILAQQILENDELRIMNYETLMPALAALGTNLLIETLPKFAAGEIKAETQDETNATFTKKFTTEDAFVDLGKDDPIFVERKIRALNPEPGVWTMQNGKRMKILEAEISEGKLKLKKIQIEGKKPQNL